MVRGTMAARNLAHLKTSKNYEKNEKALMNVYGEE
jgi:hypothetical protein